MNALSILKSKSTPLVSVTPDTLMADCVSTLAHHRIGAVIVMDEREELHGLISERDVMRALAQCGSDALRRSVKSFMTPRERLVTAGLEDGTEQLMEVMTNWRIRHVPVLSADRVVGMISMRDVVREMLDRTAEENKHLHDYLFGFRPFG